MPSAEQQPDYPTIAQLHGGAEAFIKPADAVNLYVQEVEGPSVKTAEHILGHDLKRLAELRRELNPLHETADADEARVVDPGFDSRSEDERSLVETVVDAGRFTLKEDGINPPPGKTIRRRWTGLREETQAINNTESIHEVVRRWEWGKDGLQQTGVGKILGGYWARAKEVVEEETSSDPELIEAMRGAVNVKEDVNTKNPDSDQLDRYNKLLEGLEGLGSGHQAATPIMKLRDSLVGSIEARQRRDMLDKKVAAVERILVNREREAVSTAIQDRIKRNMLPWTMPNSELTQTQLEVIKGWHAIIVDQETLPNPDDVFHVAQGMGEDTYSPEDNALLGIGNGNNSVGKRKWTRQELQDAGIFFINRVGDGEQPIFGITIVDKEGELNLKDRSFLTRDEFERVYRWQGENGYRPDGVDFQDVQRDMVMFGLRPDGAKRQAELQMQGGAGRETKYGADRARSPFVDRGFCVQNMGFGVMFIGAKGIEGKRRMNTMSTHLVFGHPDYPGVSEMQPPTVAHDQHYMTVPEFVSSLYVPPPDEREALTALQDGMRTRRESIWTGELRRD